MRITPAITALALALVLAAPIAAAQHPVDEHAGHAGYADPATAATLPADHVRWAPDAPLKAGMRRVHAAVQALQHHEMGHMDEGAVLEQAGEIDAAIAFMFANCGLEPEPDAALHGLLARLMTGTRALKSDPADAAALPGLRAAVADYPRLFDDPGFVVSGG